MRSRESEEWRDDGCCPSCGSDPLNERCSHLAAIYDCTFPSPSGESVCPVELGGQYCDATELDPLTTNLLKLLLVVKVQRGAFTAVRQEVTSLSEPLQNLIQGAVPTRKRVRAEEEGGRMSFDEYAIFRLFKDYVDAVFEAAPEANGCGSGESGGPGFTSAYRFLWSNDAGATANAATAVFRDDAAKVAKLLASLQSQLPRRSVK